MLRTRNRESASSQTKFNYSAKSSTQSRGFVRSAVLLPVHASLYVMSMPIRAISYTSNWFFSSLKPPKDYDIGVGREIEVPEGKKEIPSATSQTIGKEIPREVPSVSEAINRVPGVQQLQHLKEKVSEGVGQVTSQLVSGSEQGQKEEISKREATSKKKTSFKKEEQVSKMVISPEIVEKKREALFKNEKEVISKVTTMAKAAEDVLNTVKSEEQRLVQVLEENDKLSHQIYEYKNLVAESEKKVKQAQGVIEKEQERVSKLEQNLKEELERERNSTNLLTKILAGQKEEISSLERHIEDLQVSSEKLKELRVNIYQRTTIKEEEFTEKKRVKEKVQSSTEVEKGKMVAEGGPASNVQENVQKKGKKKQSREEFKAEETKSAVTGDKSTTSNIPAPPPLPDMRKLLGEDFFKSTGKESTSNIPTPPPLPDMRKLLGEDFFKTKEKRKKKKKTPLSAKEKEIGTPEVKEEKAEENEWVSIHRKKRDIIPKRLQDKAREVLKSKNVTDEQFQSFMDGFINDIPTLDIILTYYPYLLLNMNSQDAINKVRAWESGLFSKMNENQSIPLRRDLKNTILQTPYDKIHSVITSLNQHSKQRNLNIQELIDQVYDGKLDEILEIMRGKKTLSQEELARVKEDQEALHAFTHLEVPKTLASM